MIEPEWQPMEFSGKLPSASFGHTLSQISKTKVVLFGGATGDSGKYTMTGATYVFNLFKATWTLLDGTGNKPAPRAAHAATAVGSYKMVVYGGATGNGGLAADELYLLDIKNDGEKGSWMVVQTDGPTPGKRYGHTMTYKNTYIFLFGGNTASEPTNDTWFLPISKVPFKWEKLATPKSTPEPRIYHTTCAYNGIEPGGMVILFGGRGKDQNPRNDLWTLFKRSDGSWEWVMAPSKGKDSPAPRYQHAGFFINKMYVILGGRNNTVGEALPMSLYDTEKCEWRNLISFPRFRHSAWSHEYTICAFGGFEHTAPTTCVGKLVQLDLTDMLRPAVEAKKIEEKRELKMKYRPEEDTKSIGKSYAEEKAVFRLSPHAHIAMSYSPDVPTEIQRMIMTLPLSKLQEEPKKLIPTNPVLHMGSPLKDKPRESGLRLAQLVITQLLKPKDWYLGQGEKRFFLKPEHIIELVKECQYIVESQPIVCKVNAPVKVFGDIHGQYADLMRFFDLWRGPTESSLGGDIDSFDYVFLGDYVDRGTHSLETICLLMALKIKYPTQVHLLRGNHEDKCINNAFGFSEECAERLGEDVEEPGSVFETINQFFNWLPLAAVIDDRIICLHGGIGYTVNNVEDISRMIRPLEVVHEAATMEQQMLIDILWSDPTETDQDMGVHINSVRDPNSTGNIYSFGPDRVEKFLKQNKLELIVRGHECVMDGFERFAKGQLITVFSATDYCGKHKNAGAALFVHKNYEVLPKLIYPLDMSTHSNWIENDKRPPTPPRSKGSESFSSSFA